MSTSLEHTQQVSPEHTHPARNTVSNHRLSGLDPELEPNPDLAAISLTTPTLHSQTWSRKPSMAGSGTMPCPGVCPSDWGFCLHGEYLAAPSVWGPRGNRSFPLSFFMPFVIFNHPPIRAKLPCRCLRACMWQRELLLLMGAVTQARFTCLSLTATQ